MEKAALLCSFQFDPMNQQYNFHKKVIVSFYEMKIQLVNATLQTK
jgi:hypothetical protein